MFQTADYICEGPHHAFHSEWSVCQPCLGLQLDNMVSHWKFKLRGHYNVSYYDPYNQSINQSTNQMFNMRSK